MKTGPIVREISTILPAAAVFALFAGEPGSVFLDSAKDSYGMGRYSFIASDPFLTLRCKGRQVILEDSSGRQETEDDPFGVLQRLLNRYRMEKVAGLPPFTGGVIGYFGYDLGYLLEKIPGKSQDDLVLPDCWLGFYDVVIIFDHHSGKQYLAANGFPETDETARRQRAKQRLDEFAARIAMAAPLPTPQAQTTAAAFASTFTREEYEAAVRRCIEYIAAGDIFQVNMSQRFSAPLTMPPYEAYCYLRQINPAPFASYLNFGEGVIASASPERYMLLKDRDVETRPIKGTRPRGSDAVTDQRMREELENSEKDRSELVMIIDLERNDLGRVCEFGSVRVPELIRLEEYATVFHLVSTVVGRMATDKDAVDLIRASFPGGSITGAPKVRAMEIIDELEPYQRSVYTGSIGYIDFNGDADLNIVIRTFIFKDQQAYFQVGGAIVADSDPTAEYFETLDKGRALFKTLGYTV
ncbi:MAG TPA: aminodeoxychorismate synthase component I [Patescibacteria group bacterium]|nr:aminodeoxychorismate synthase component I [Patescibacteria group bacterium]